MKHFFSLTFFFACAYVATFGQMETDTSKTRITLRATNPPTDSNVLVVINGKIAGTIREIKKDINNLLPADIIESVNVVKGSAANEKYGEKGSYGVLEITLKNATTKYTSDIPDTTGTPDISVEKLYEKVEIEASFPGGDAIWRRYLERTLDASTPAKNGAPDGTYTVIVQFIVDKAGNISDVRALTSHGYGMEAEVIRVIKKGPKWSPAFQDGRHVRAYRKQPVTFMVISEKKIKKNKNQD